MERDWKRLGRHIQAARKARALTQPELGELVGAKRATIANIEAGQEFKKITPTLRAIEREFWVEGSVEKILDGGDPAPLANAAEPRSDSSAPAGLAALPPAVQEALARDGKVIDASVFDVELPGVNGEMILVFKDKPKVPPEVAAADVIEIAKRYLKLRGIVPPEGNGDDAAAQA